MIVLTVFNVNMAFADSGVDCYVLRFFHLI